MEKLFAIILVLQIALFAVPATADVVIVKDGIGKAQIVIEKDATQKARSAAADLQRYIEKMSGVKLALITDSEYTGSTAIAVGKSKLTDDVDIPTGITIQRRDEGYVIKSGNGRIILAGNESAMYHGTEYAVYDFLYRLGVRWYMPGEYGEYVPKRTDITFKDVNLTERPDFVLRDWWGHVPAGLDQDLNIWKIRNRLNPQSIDMFTIPRDGSLTGLIPKELAKTRPELFAKKKDGSVDENMPSLTNPEAIKMVADALKQRIRETHVESIGFSPEDGMPADFSAETKKNHLGLLSKGGRVNVPDDENITEEWITFVNAVGTEVRKEFPNVYITTNGYANRANPPIGVKPLDNSVIMFADVFYCAFHPMGDKNCWISKREGELLRGWCSVSDNVWQYGYQPLLISGLVPLPDARNAAKEVKFLKDSGSIGFFDESRYVWAEYSILGRYTKARMSWDADIDPEPVWSDFYRNWYGAAAPSMRRYYDAIMDRMQSYEGHGHEDRSMVTLYTPALMAELAKYLAQAEKTADTDRAKAHVALDSLIYKHLADYIAMNDRLQRGDYSAAAMYGRSMLDLRKEINRVNPFMLPDHENLNGQVDYSTGVWYWTITDRIAYYTKEADKMNGKTGTLVTLLPEKAQFKIDPRDEGIWSGWYGDGAKGVRWESINPALPIYLQGYADKDGYSYAGPMWYKFDINLPGVMNQKVHLCIPEMEVDGWLFVNGQFVGRRGSIQTYERPSELDMDISAFVKPGANSIVIRSTGEYQPGASPGGITSRGFVYVEPAKLN